jgi:iron(III) transport system substrate-binding protein
MPTVRPTRRPRVRLTAALAAVALAAAACASATDDPPPPEVDGGVTEGAAAADADGPLTVYSGRSEELVGDVLAGFTDATGIELEVRYGDTAELAATIINEGDASPADVYFGQDAGALGALQAEGRLAPLPDDLVGLVDPAFASTSGEWVGVTGRVRVLAYSTERLEEADVPDSVLDLTDPQWQGRV